MKVKKLKTMMYLRNFELNKIVEVADEQLTDEMRRVLLP